MSVLVRDRHTVAESNYLLTYFETNTPIRKWAERSGKVLKIPMLLAERQEQEPKAGCLLTSHYTL